LIKKLEDLELTENTIFVFTSDNGGLHVPELNHEKVTHNTPFRAGKGYVYEGGQRVPLIVNWPGHISEGRVVDTPVNNVDWIPTLMELAGADAPRDIDGISFADGLKGGEFPERPIFWHFPHYTNQGGRPSGAMRDGDWLLVELYDENKAELYDLSVDLEEKNDVADQNTEVLNSMRSALDKWRIETKVQYNTPNPDCEEEEFRKLYVDLDPSKFEPLTADEEEWKDIQTWRNGMDVIVRKGRVNK